LSKLIPRPPQPAPSAREEAQSGSKQQRVWIVRNGKLDPIPVTTGTTDGVMTEVTAGNVEPGMALVVDIVNKTS
jgi:HlyD family secretion protein